MTKVKRKDKKEKQNQKGGDFRIFKINKFKYLKLKSVKTKIFFLTKIFFFAQIYKANSIDRFIINIPYFYNILRKFQL